MSFSASTLQRWGTEAAQRWGVGVTAKGSMRALARNHLCILAAVVVSQVYPRIKSGLTLHTHWTNVNFLALRYSGDIKC